MLKNNPYMKAYLNVIDEDVNNKVNVRRYRSIAAVIGGKYIPETNTIDCKGYDVRFKNTWLTNGTFDFKLINTSNDWSNMFYNCDKLTHLPDNFTIPNSVINCSEMFNWCKSLTYLPKNFHIPDNVLNYDFIFDNCDKLKNKNPEAYMMWEI